MKVFCEDFLKHMHLSLWSHYRDGLKEAWVQTYHGGTIASVAYAENLLKIIYAVTLTLIIVIYY
jgi:hypothetical protein